jgi:glucose-6-phosphate dehydrogenase assembly protein OpcA
MSTGLSPDQILSDMTKLWRDLGKQGLAETGMGVLRACTMTLVVVVPEQENPGSVGEAIAGLMPRHPARTILISLRRDARQLTAGVTAACWKPFGQRRQVCSEQVEITAPEASLEDVTSVTAALAAPDLPLIVWCRCRSTFESPEFAGLAGSARKVIVNSSGWPEPTTLRRLAAMSERGVILGDLAWTHLTRWREALSQVFENAAYAVRLPEVAQVRARFSQPNMAGMARYLGAWVLNSLETADVRAELKLEAEAPVPAVELLGEHFRVELRREGQRLVTTANQTSSCTSLPEPDEVLLLSEELNILRHDPIFEETLAAASQL